MPDINLFDRSVEELAGYVLTPEENKMYSDDDLKRLLADLGFPETWPDLIPRLRGEVSWYHEYFYE